MAKPETPALKKNPAVLLLAFVLVQAAAPEIYARQDSSIRTRENNLAEEFVIGEEIHQTIMASFHPYTEPKAVAYVEKIGGDLAAHAERKELSYRFTILYNDKIYASSSPGGRVYVTTGLIFFLENEAELAAVLAHEIGELQYKDPKVSSSRRMLDRVTETGAMVAPAFGPLGALASLGFIGIHAISKSTVKTPEERLLVSDRRAMDYMVKAGYDPQGMVDVFYRFASIKKEALPYFLEYYQSRPLTMERTTAMQKRFSQLKLDGRDFDVHRQEYLEMTKGIREIYKA